MMNTKFWRLALAACCITLFATTHTAHAQSIWNGSVSADWNTPENWDNNTVPVGGGGGDPTNNGRIMILGGGDPPYTATISADVPTPNDVEVGFGTSGQLNQTGGTVTLGGGNGFGWMSIGQNAGGDGIYNFSGGTVNAGRIYLGRGGASGRMDMSGTASAELDSHFIIGDGQGAVGEATISGDAAVHANSEVWVGDAGASGTLNMDSGTVEADTWIAVGRNSATGVVNLSGTATLRKLVEDGNADSARSFITVGGLGSGAGGTVNITGEALLESQTNMVLSETANRYGIINQSGGTVILKDNTANTDGFNDSLELDQSGTGAGEYHLSGGLLRAETIDAETGVFDMTGGTLVATNFVGNLDQNGGTTSPGNSPGIMLVTGNYSLVSGDLFMEIEGTGAGTGYDQLIVTGDVSLAGDLTLAGAYVPSLGESFTLIDNQGANAISGGFTGIAEGSTVIFNGFSLTATYLGGDGNDFVLFSVPEPSSLALIALGLVGIAVRRK